MTDKITNTPKLRFKGYTDTWEHRKLGKMGATFTGLFGKTKEDFGHGDAEFITYMNVFSNPIALSNGTESVEVDSRQSEVKYGDVLFTTSSETPDEVGMSSVWLDNRANVYLNSFCFGWRPAVEIDPYYLAYMLRSAEVRKRFTFLAQGISRYNISKNKVMEMSVPMPSLGEQQRIGEFFTAVSDLITLHQRQLALLKIKKQTFLSKMFPKDGTYRPEIRFEGFTDAWEQCKLGEYTTLITKGTTPKDKSGQGYINFVKVENISNGKIIPVSRISEEEHDNYLKRSRLEVDDILFSIAGTLGRTAAVEKSILPANTNQALAIIRGYKFEKNFLITSLTGNVVAEYIRKNPTVGAQPNLSLEQVRNLLISCPSFEEQTKIGTFFKHLDSLITLHQRKLETLKTMKKTLLNQMFV